MKKRPYQNEKGMALIVALLMSLTIMAMVTGVIYFVTQSTTMSGAGKRYANAEDAADGAVNVVKDTINLALWGEPVAAIFPNSGACDSGTAADIVSAILTDGSTCSTTINLPGAVNQFFTANVTVERLSSFSLVPGRRGPPNHDLRGRPRSTAEEGYSYETTPHPPCADIAAAGFASADSGRYEQLLQRPALRQSLHRPEHHGLDG
jgi:hypothetical protein